MREKQQQRAILTAVRFTGRLLSFPGHAGSAESALQKIRGTNGKFHERPFIFCFCRQHCKADGKSVCTAKRRRDTFNQSNKKFETLFRDNTCCNCNKNATPHSERFPTAGIVVTARTLPATKFGEHFLSSFKQVTMGLGRGHVANFLCLEFHAECRTVTKSYHMPPPPP